GSATGPAPPHHQHAAATPHQAGNDLHKPYACPTAEAIPAIHTGPAGGSSAEPARPPQEPAIASSHGPSENPLWPCASSRPALPSKSCALFGGCSRMVPPPCPANSESHPAHRGAAPHQHKEPVMNHQHQPHQPDRSPTMIRRLPTFLLAAVPA